MNNDNMKRELQKVLLTLEWVSRYFERTSEANAALHKSEKVMYSPLASEVDSAKQSIQNALSELE